MDVLQTGLDILDHEDLWRQKMFVVPRNILSSHHFIKLGETNYDKISICDFVRGFSDNILHYTALVSV